MGISTLFRGRTVTSQSVRHQISRSDLIRMVTNAVDASGIRSINPALAERLINVGRTADQVDARAWKCSGSCGCPLTQAGVVSFAGEMEGALLGRQEDLYYKCQNFYNHFDSDATNKFGARSGSGLILYVV